MQKNLDLIWQNTLEPNNKKHKTGLVSISSDVMKKIILKVNDLKDQIIIIKLDSIVLQDDDLLKNFVDNINIINSCGAKIIIIHDYCDLVEHTLKFFGVDNAVINDFKFLNIKNAQMVEMVLSGYINKNIVSKLCEAGCNAIGISGKDGNFIQAKKSKSLVKRLNEESIIDIGFICEPIIINPEILLNLEDMELIPVISPIANDENFNTSILDANLTASAIATLLNADHLILTMPTTIILKDDIFKSKDLKVIKNILNNHSSSKEILEAAKNFIDLGPNNFVHLINPLVADSILISLLNEN